MQNVRQFRKPYTSIAEWPLHHCPECNSEFRSPASSPVRCQACYAAADAKRAAAATAAAMAPTESRQSLAQRMAESGVPATYLRYTRPAWEERWGAWEERESLASLIEWPPIPASHRDWFLMLWGPAGGRKTSVVTSVLSEALARGLTCRWWDTADLMDRLKLGFKRETAESNGERLSPTLRAAVPAYEIAIEAKDCDLLVLDDCVVDTPFEARTVARLLRHRHARGAATAMTANCRDPFAMLAGIDANLVSRCDTRRVWELNDGIDYRRLEAASND